MNNDPEPLSLGPATEFSTDSLDGTSLTHTASVIEIPFSEDVTAAGGAAGSLTLGDNITVSVDGQNVTGRYVLDADGSADGEVVVTSATPVDPGATVTVAVDAANDSADTETITPGRVDVTVADATADEGGDTDAYANETVAFVTAEPDRTFEVYNGSGAFVFTGRTGAGSQVFAFDTAARNWSGAHTIESVASDGGVAATTEVALRDLGLSVAVADRTVTPAQGIEARVSAADSGRALGVALVAADGTVVERRTRTIGGNGGVTVEFGGDRLAEAGPGNYTINATDPATGTTVSSGRVRVVDADARTATVRPSVVAEHAGDVAVIDLELRYADTATVTIGGSDVGYRANATVADRDGDGSVRVRFNTAAAADATTLPDDGGAVFETAPTAGNASSTSDAVVAAEVGDHDAVSTGLAAGEYDLTVRPGPNAGAAATGVGTLVLRQPSPQRLDTWVAPADATFSTPAEISTAVAAGRLTDATEVAVGDVVVHRIDAPGIAGALADAPGNTTQAFFGLAGTGDGDRYGLNVTQRDPGANENPYRLRLNNTTARVVADAANDTYFVVYRSDGPDAVPWNGTAAVGPPDPDAPAAGDSLSASFTVRPDGPFADLDRSERRLTDTHTLVTARIGTDGPVTVANATNQSVAGTTTLAPGTEFDLRLRADNETEPPFLKTARAVVGPEGGWTATVDFDDRHVGDTFTVRSAAATVAPANELVADGEVRATPGRNTSTPTARPTTTAAGAPGGGGSGGDDGSASDRGPDTPPPAPTATATPSETTASGGSVLGSTRQFLGGVLGTAVGDTDPESVKDRLFEFDVAVAVAALTVVVIYVSRQG